MSGISRRLGGQTYAQLALLNEGGVYINGFSFDRRGCMVKTTHLHWKDKTALHSPLARRLFGWHLPLVY